MANLVESSVFDQDIYLKMIEILKHDILILKKRGFDRDILLRKDTTKLRSLRNEEFNKTRLSYRCKDMLQSIEKTVNHKQIERRSKINSFYDVLNRRYDTLRKK